VVSSSFRWLLDLIFPPRCPICQTIVSASENGRIICSACKKDIKPIQPPYCPRCGLPYYPSEEDGGEEKSHLCGSCLQEQRYFEIHRTCALYEGALKEAIHRFKYGGVFSLVRIFGDLLQSTLTTLTQDYSVDVMVPVPLHIRRLRERGFNQALLLAKELNTRTGIPYAERALKKVKDTSVQIALKKKERKKNLKGAFQVKDHEAIQGKTVVLMDDVYTTGATVNECSRTLLEAGADRVAVLTVSRAI
jgi:ComF family protein